MPNASSTARAHRGADRDFFLTRGASSEKKIRDVRTGDEEDEPNCAEKREERWLHLADETFLEDRKRNVPAFVRVGKFLRELGVYGAEAGLRLIEIDARIEPRSGHQRTIVARFFSGFEPGSHPDLGLLRQLEAGRHYTNNRDCSGADLDLFADDARIGAESAFP